jgi:hypothetical protein
MHLQECEGEEKGRNTRAHSLISSGVAWHGEARGTGA